MRLLPVCRPSTLNRRKARAARRVDNEALITAAGLRKVTFAVRRAIRRRGEQPPTARAIVTLASEKYGFGKDKGSEAALLQAANELMRG